MGRRDLADVGGAGVDDDERVDGGGEAGQFLDQGVGEDVLGDGDADGAAEGVEENGDGAADGDVDFLEHGLHRDEGDLDA